MRRVHCPECGTKANPGTSACVACGHVLPVVDADAGGSGGFNVARTMVGVAGPSTPAARPSAPADDAPTPGQTSGAAAKDGRTKLGGVAPDASPRVPSQVQRTMLGGVSPVDVAALKAQQAAAQPTTKDGTLIGVPKPGAPVARPSEPNAAREMPHELGATIVPEPARLRRPKGIGAERIEAPALLVNRDKLAKRRVVLPPVRPKEDQARLAAQQRRRRLLSIIGAVALVSVVVIGVVVYVTRSSPVSARVRATNDGHEAVEIQCPGCPDGTKVSIGDATATMAGRVAQIPLVAPLRLGENLLKVSLDRPGRSRGETVGIPVNVSYRVRPDLSKLVADKPTIHLAIEATSGTDISIDGNPVKLSDGPSAYAVDVAADCSGSSDEPATLHKRIPYVVKFSDGTHEDGVVDVAVGIVPLRIDAPGPRVVTESDTFVLSGHTMKGAEVLVAGRPIQIGPDGSFAQRMSVSSTGATNVEVRAKVPGMAPRIVPIAVQRVERLELAAKEFQKEKPVGYTTLSLVSPDDAGRSVIVGGQIAEVRTQNHQTTYLLEVSAQEGCSKTNEPCRVRLLHGAGPSAKVGDQITAYGLIAKPSAVSGGAPMPVVNVAFTLPGANRSSP